MESVFQLFASTFEICSLIGKELVGFPSPSNEPSKRQQEGIAIHVIQQVKMYSPSCEAFIYNTPPLLCAAAHLYYQWSKKSTPVE